MLGPSGNPACWEHNAATRGQRTAGNLCSRPQPTAKLPSCSWSSVRTSVPLTLAEAGASGRRARILPPLRLPRRNCRGVHETASQWALGSPALRRPGRGAEPCALREAAGLAGSGASLRLTTPERAGSRREEAKPAPGAPANPSTSPSCFAGHPRTHVLSSGVVTSARRLERGPDREPSAELSRRMPGCWLCPQAAPQSWQGRQSR